MIYEAVPGPFGVVQSEYRWARPLISNPYDQRDLDSFVEATLADSCSATGNDHEYYGLPDMDVPIIGWRDLARAVRRSPVLRDKSPEDIEDTLLKFVPGSIETLCGPQRIRPFVTPVEKAGLVNLGVEFTSGPISEERDQLYQGLTRGSGHRLSPVAISPFQNVSKIVLISGVDPQNEGHLIDAFHTGAEHFTGRVALGEAQLVFGHEPNHARAMV